MPKSAQELEKKLPGVGRYTAGAIASIALGEVKPVDVCLSVCTFSVLWIFN